MTDRIVPDALLLDFGGVLYTSVHHDDGGTRTAKEIGRLLLRGGAALPDPATIERDLGVALLAESGWKTGASRLVNPTEMPGSVFWGELVAGDWSRAARALLVAHAAHLSRYLVEAVASYEVRPGVVELLAEAERVGVPVAVVSNTRSGAAFRDLLRRDGLDGAIALTVFSDEVGIRKPNPEMLRLASAGLGVAPARCWYAGDHYDRDVMCARRAGIGVAVLIRDKKTAQPPFPVQAAPDIEVDSPAELVPILAACRGAHGPESASATCLDRPRVNVGAGTNADRPRVFRPSALLLDHGGVVATSQKSPAGRAAFAERVVDYLERTGWCEFDSARVEADIDLANRRHGDLKVPADGWVRLAQMSHAEFWRDLVAAEWPEHPRAAVTINATPLMVDLVSTRSDRTLRPGIIDLLGRCAEEEIPVGIVSNTLCGAVVREFGRRVGTAPYFGVEIYSDELGFRKPDPLMIETAAAALGVDPAECWYVGDKPERDLACARLAGVGRAVLMQRGDKSQQDFDADLVVADPFGLLESLAAVLR